MGQTDKLPDTEDFTKEVENVIDDLFAPAKSIEIDPLTNEIKDLDETPDQPLDELPLEMDITSEEGEQVQPAEQGDQVAEEKTGSSSSESVEFDLNLEMEFEPESEPEAVPPAGKDASEQAPGGETAEVGSGDLLNEIQQAVWTLEWEVTEDSIRKLKDMLKKLGDGSRITDQGFARVISEMDQVLADMEQDAENVPTSAPVALKKGVEYLMAADSGENDTDNLRKFLNEALLELNAAFASHDKAEERPAPASAPDVGEQTEFLDLEIETGPEPESEMASEPEVEPEESQSGEAAATDTGASPTSREPSQSPEPPSVGPRMERSETPVEIPPAVKAESSKIFNEHLNALRDCVKRIRPVEELLAKTRGMKKLHLFLGDLRSRLEKQVNLLQDALGGEIPVIPAATAGEANHGAGPDIQPQEQKETKCPWRELFIAGRGSITVGLLPEEVAFHGTVPFWAGSGLMNQEKIALKRLKPWPWSKLSSLVQGNLLAIKEKELAQMEVPVIQFTDPASNAESGHNVVILSQGSTTAALFLDSEPDYFSLKEDHTYEPADPETPWEGVLKVDGSKIIHIISVARINEIKP